MEHNAKSKLLYNGSKKAFTLSIAIALFSAAESSAASNALTTTTDIVESKFVSVNAERAIKDQYIVVLKDQYVDQQISTIFGQTSIDSTSARDYRRYVVENTVAEMASMPSVTVKQQYHTALSGFAAQMTTTDMRALLEDERVAYIEQDQIVSINATQSNATQGLDRIDQANLPLDSQYTYDFDGSGVYAYVLDTGIDIDNSDFGGRAINGIDTVDNDFIANDCHGHGTHVAGIIGSLTYGVAKNVTLVAVRVVDCEGEGPMSDAIAGVNWATQNAMQNPTRPAVINMSFGGFASVVFDASVQNAINSGITIVASAGNDNSDACSISPARVADVLTVASSTVTDTRSFFSNWGTCVDLFAPGSNITSLWRDGNVNTISGTSMAAPHVAGVTALYLQSNPSASPARVNADIVSSAVYGKFADTNINDSPNRLLQSTFSGLKPPLERGEALTGLFDQSGVEGNEVIYTMEVPAGATDLNLDLGGALNGRGMGGLYVKFGSAPIASSGTYDCGGFLIFRPIFRNSSRNCNFPNPSEGIYYIVVKAFSNYQGVSLEGNYTIR